MPAVTTNLRRSLITGVLQWQKVYSLEVAPGLEISETEARAAARDLFASHIPQDTVSATPHTTVEEYMAIAADFRPLLRRLFMKNLAMIGPNASLLQCEEIDLRDALHLSLGNIVLHNPHNSVRVWHLRKDLYPQPV